MKAKFLIPALILSLFLMQCTNTSGDDLIPQDQQQQNPDPTANVTYNNTIKSVMTNNCISCHGNPPSGGAPNSYTTYTQVKNDVNKIIEFINSASNPMPPSGQMPSSTRSLFQQWKNDGLLEN